LGDASEQRIGRLEGRCSVHGRFFVLRVRVLLSSVGSSRDEHAASSIRPCKRESIATIRVRNDRRDVVESERRYLPLYLHVK
jgi:hypothetical protein